MGQRRRHSLRPARRLLARHPVLVQRCAVELRLEVELTQLLAAGAPRRTSRRDLVGRRRKEALPRAGAHDRRGPDGHRR